MDKDLLITKQDLMAWLERPLSDNDIDLCGFIATRLENFYKLEKEIKRLNNIIEKLEQENAVLKTQVLNKDKYTYGIRMGSDKE